MPANVVKTEEDERLWKKAKEQAKKQGKGDDYAYIMGIFQKMKGNGDGSGSEKEGQFNYKYANYPVFRRAVDTVLYYAGIQR